MCAHAYATPEVIGTLGQATEIKRPDLDVTRPISEPETSVTPSPRLTTCQFGPDDAEYIAKHLDPAQIRNELETALQKGYSASFYQGSRYEISDDSYPWMDYADACREAIKIQRRRLNKAGAHRDCPSNRIDVEDLKRHLDIVDVIGHYVDLKKAGRSHKGLCPFHDEKTPSFTVSPERGTWHCFGACNDGGDVIKFIMLLENIDFKTAIGRLSCWK